MEILNKYVYNPQEDLLGKGGFATVYKAFDKVLEIPVALKFFQPQDQGNKYNIINEIKRAIMLSHPNVVKYYGVETLVNRNVHGEQEEVQIGIMEYVQEGQLKTYMSRNPLTNEQLIKLLIDILEGLKYLHSEGIIHRDIKPQNILLGRDKQGRLVAKIADFGISKAADSNQASASILLGTIEYMAPEQFNPDRFGVNKRISYNVDVWAFGVTAYYLLTGDLLFGSRSGNTSAAEMINKIVHLEGLEDKLRNIAEPFKALFAKCIVPHAEQRTSNIDELIATLKPGHSVSALPSSYHTSAPANNTYTSSPVSAMASSAEETMNIDAALGNNDATQAIDYTPRQASGPIQATGEPLPAKKKSKAVVWIIAAVVLLGGGGFAYTQLFMGNGVVAANGTNASEQQTLSAAALAVAQIDSAMVTIEGGDFKMGKDKSPNAFETPMRPVTVSSFKMLNSEVTRNMWNAIMEDNRFKDSLDYPATNVSWEDAKQYIKKLNKVSGKTFRLPTEAEWEYACVKGVTSVKLDINEISWNPINSEKKVHPVKTRQPDGVGLYDMLGNVFEWCEDWLIPDPSQPSLKGKAIRGGAYDVPGDAMFWINPKSRNLNHPNQGNNIIGFRLAADL